MKKPVKRKSLWNVTMNPEEVEIGPERLKAARGICAEMKRAGVKFAIPAETLARRDMMDQLCRRMGVRFQNLYPYEDAGWFFSPTGLAGDEILLLKDDTADGDPMTQAMAALKACRILNRPDKTKRRTRT